MKTLQRLAWMGLALCLMALPASAGGLFIYELGNPGTGVASVGWASPAQPFAWCPDQGQLPERRTA